jgi:tripartite ATP-independent transporter DctP family solute receptor
MATITRRSFTLGAGAAASVFAITGRANAAKIRWRFANNAPLDYPLNVRSREAAQTILERTDGGLDIQIFPNGQLGSDTDMLSQVRSGAVNMFTLSPLIISTLAPSAAMSAMGFALPDYATVWEAMDGEVGAFVRDGIARAGLHTLAQPMDNGFRVISSSVRPITSADDLSGFKIRVPVSPIQISIFTALGASPVSINYSELYTALQTGVVDGQENPLALFPFARFDEVQKYGSLSNHMWDGFWVLVNQRSWNELPDEYKQIVSEVFADRIVRQREDMRKLNDAAVVDMESKGMVFNVPDPESFRAKLREAKFYEEWAGKFGEAGWAALERYSGPLI